MTLSESANPAADAILKALDDKVAQIAATARREEREACAQIAEDGDICECDEPHCICSLETANSIASKIRNRAEAS